jgi:hypothetical protein
MCLLSPFVAFCLLLATSSAAWRQFNCDGTHGVVWLHASFGNLSRLHHGS